MNLFKVLKFLTDLPVNGGKYAHCVIPRHYHEDKVRGLCFRSIDFGAHSGVDVIALSEEHVETEKVEGRLRTADP